MSGMEGGENRSKLGSLGGRVSTLANLRTTGKGLYDDTECKPTRRSSRTVMFVRNKVSSQRRLLKRCKIIIL